MLLPLPNNVDYADMPQAEVTATFEPNGFAPVP